MDITRGEMVEGDLDRLIERRNAERCKTEGERLEAELWAESVERYNAHQEEKRRLAWCEHFRKMRGLHWALADGYDTKLRELENGHEERNGHHG